MIEMAPLPRGIRTLRNDELDRLKARYPNVPASPKQCITCGGTGFFRWWADDKRTEVADWKCDCIGQWKLHLYLLNANIGLNYQRLGWADATGVEDGAIAKVNDYIVNLDGYVRSGIGLILYGTMTGTGKTLLASLLLKHMLAKGIDGYFTTFSEMIDTYTGGWNNAEEKEWFHRRIKNAGALVMDDIGREYQGRKHSGLPESTFEEVIRHRVAAGTPTFPTSNLAMDALQQGYGGNVMSLLHECSSTYRFVGRDFRDDARERLVDWANLGLTRPVVIG